MRRAVLIAFVVALVCAPGAGAWTWPAGGVVLQHFHFDPAHPYAAGQHRGIDVAGSVGDQVLAPRSGTVTFAGTVPSSGNTITIETDDGLAVTLTDLGSIGVSRGSTVTEGAAVGTIGTPGGTGDDQAFVQLGVRIASEAQGYLDPESLLPTRPAAPQPTAGGSGSPPPTSESAEAASTPQEPPTASTSAPASPPTTAPAAQAPEQAPASPTPDATPEPPVPATVSTPGESPASVSAPAAPGGVEIAASSGVTMTARGHAAGQTPPADRTATEARPERDAPLHAASATAAETRPHRRARGASRGHDAIHPATPPSHGRSLPPPRPATMRPRDAGMVTAAARRMQSRASVHAQPRTAPDLRITLLSAVLLVALLAVVAAWLGVRGGAKAARIIARDGDEPAQDSGGAGLAVFGGVSAPWARGGIRAVRRVRALPPARGQRRPGGEWNRRARDAGHGRRRQGREVLS